MKVARDVRAAPDRIDDLEIRVHDDALERDSSKWNPHPEEPRGAWRLEGSATDVL